MGSIRELVKALREGEIVTLQNGNRVFKLSSYEGNPVVGPRDLGLTWEKDGKTDVGAVFNGGAELFDDRVILAPRAHRDYWKSTFFDPKLGRERPCLENYVSEIWILESEDGVNFRRFDNVVIKGDGTDHKDFVYGIEDIRIIKHDTKYLLVGCGKIKPPFKGENADRVAIYSTEDFRNITYHGIIRSFDSRNAVPFYLDGEWYIFLRFYPNIHLVRLEAGLEQLLYPEKHEKLWQKAYDEREKSLFLSPGDFPHEKEKIGAGPQLVKTERGLLFIYHSVGEIKEEIASLYGLAKPVDRAYSVSMAILDPEKPYKIIARTKYPLYIPNKPYELYGDDEYPVDVPAVVFPTGAILMENKLLIYAGAGDKYMILLSADIDKLLDYMFEESKK